MFIIDLNPSCERALACLSVSVYSLLDRRLVSWYVSVSLLDRLMRYHIILSFAAQYYTEYGIAPETQK